MKNNLQQDLVLNDIHAPYEDPRAIKLVLNVAKELRIHNFIQTGDLIDLYSVSDHSKDKLRAKGLGEEIDYTNELLDSLDKIKIQGNKFFFSGNHEWRFERYLMNRVPEIYGLEDFRVEKLLRLKDRGFICTPYRRFRKIGKIHYTHEVGYSGQQALIRNGAAFEASCITGHTHRLGVHVFGSATGVRHVSASFGWLGSNDGAEYLHTSAKNRGWQLGFGIVSRESNGVSHVQAIPIVDYKCVVNGKLYKG